MTSVEVLERRERLFRPPNGRVSNDLEVLSKPGIRRVECLCDADREALLPPKRVWKRRHTFVEPPVLNRDEVPPVTIRLIARTVAQFFGVSIVDIMSDRRFLRITLPRQVIFYLCTELTTRPFAEIGRVIGGKDHSTVMYGVDKIKRMIADDPVFAKQVEAARQFVMFTAGDTQWL